MRCETAGYRAVAAPWSELGFRREFWPRVRKTNCVAVLISAQQRTFLPCCAKFDSKSSKTENRKQESDDGTTEAQRHKAVWRLERSSALLTIAVSSRRTLGYYFVVMRCFRIF